jgi:hypothetical protein
MKDVLECIYMLLDVLVHCRNHWDEFWVKNSKICTTDPKNHAISEIYANSEILQQGLRPSCANSVALWMGQHALACWSILGSVVRSDAFHSTFYDFVIPKQHLINAHNIKQTSNQESW